MRCTSLPRCFISPPVSDIFVWLTRGRPRPLRRPSNDLASRIGRNDPPAIEARYPVLPLDDPEIVRRPEAFFHRIANSLAKGGLCFGHLIDGAIDPDEPPRPGSLGGSRRKNDLPA